MRLKLVRPTNEYADQVMEYKAAMIKNGDSLDGCAGLEEVNNFSEWIKFESRLKKKYGKYNQLDEINEVIVVYKNNVLVGAGSIRYYDEKNVELKRIYISPAFRGQGIGTKLVSLLIEWAKELGYQRVLLETGEKLTESVALYKKLGFERIPIYGPYESMPESLCMAKDI